MRSFLFPFLKITTITAFFHVVGIRLSDKAFNVQLSKCLRDGIFCFQCVDVKYGHCLLLSHSSYLVVLLPPPIKLSLVHLLGQCELYYSVPCRIARCRIPLLFYSVILS